MARRTQEIEPGSPAARRSLADSLLKLGLRHLRAQLAQGPRPDEAKGQFIERLFDGLEELLASIAAISPARRGRPRKGFLTGLRVREKKTRGRPPHPSRPGLQELVDAYKAQVEREEARAISDARAIVELLYQLAPPSVRKELDARLAHHLQRAETRYAERHALRRAVVDVEGDRFERFTKALSETRDRKSVV